MKKLIMFAILFLFLKQGFSQNQNFEQPDYKKIAIAIKDSDSNLFYNKLMQRYHASDTTMTLNERRHLYFGYVNNEKYAPYGNSNFNDSLSIVLNKKNIEMSDFDLLNKFSDAILKEYPFDLRTMNIKLYALEKMFKITEFQNCLTKATMVLDAILSTGDGLSKETAFYVINPSHEYDILDIIGFQFGDEQRLIDHYDYLKLAENDSNIEGLYFDVSPCLNALNNMFK